MQPNNINRAEQSQTESRWVAVTGTATCKRCKKTDLAWQQGKTGKWYLCVTRRSKDERSRLIGAVFTNAKNSAPNFHGVEVSDADIPF